MEKDANSQNESCVFSSLWQALHYYRLNNPARQKSVNLLEPDKRQAKTDNREHAEIKYSAVVRALIRTREAIGRDKYLIFQLCDIGLQRHGFSRCHPEDVASYFGRSERVIRRALYQARKTATEQLIRLGCLLPSED
jgi:hypothetical protein